MIIFIFDIILVLLISIILSALLKPKRLTIEILYVSLISIGNIVFVSEMASILILLNNKSFFILTHIIMLSILILIWYRFDKPSLLKQFFGYFSNLNNKIIIENVKEYPELWILGIAIIVFYLINAFLIIYVPPNNWDSMTVHMTRVGYWLQHGSFAPWPTGDIRQVVYPVNAQSLILWSVLMSGSNHFAGFVQWLSVPLGMVAIYGLAQTLHASRAQSVFAAFIWTTLTQVIMQSSSTQNDLIASSLFTAALFLLYSGIKTNQRSTIAVSALSLALSLGTKQSVVALLPGLAFTLILILIFGKGDKKITFKNMVIWGGVALVAVMLVGSYMYITNIHIYGNPLSNETQYRKLQPNYTDKVNVVTKISLLSLYECIDGC